MLPRAAILALAALLGWQNTARADAVPPEPKDCPPGETGRTSHDGVWCEPAPPPEGCPLGSAWQSSSRASAACYSFPGSCQRCADPTACPGCQPVSLCVEQIDREECWRCNNPGRHYIEERVHGYCGIGCSCAPPAKCVTIKRFIAPRDAGESPQNLICSDAVSAGPPAKPASVPDKALAPPAGCGLPRCAAPGGHAGHGHGAAALGVALGWTLASRRRRRPSR